MGLYKSAGDAQGHDNEVQNIRGKHNRQCERRQTTL